MSGFRVTSWDPPLIIGQIVAVQASLYVSFGLLLCLGAIFTGAEISLQNIFSFKAINFGDVRGIVTTSSYILTALLGAFSLWLIVRRTKLCLDFTVTAYFVHLIVCWCYNGQLPNTISWWFITGVGITIMTVSGEFLCLRREMQDIPLLTTQRVDL